MGHRVREYCPVGELIPGMAYLVRRLLENTSNEGFLRAKFASNLSSGELLRDPRELIAAVKPPEEAAVFRNVPLTDFTLETERAEMGAAIRAARANCGKHYPLVIGGKEIVAEEEMVSINPAHPAEMVGRVAKATMNHVDLAIDAARKAQAAGGRRRRSSAPLFLRRRRR